MIILTAEDDPEDFEFFQEAIREIDPSIVLFWATNGLELLNILDQSILIPDFIFLDINMPRMDGRTCFAEIKKHEKFRDVPVVVYSTSKDKKEIVHFETHRARFLVKPNNFRQLVMSLKILLGYGETSGDY